MNHNFKNSLFLPLLFYFLTKTYNIMAGDLSKPFCWAFMRRSPYVNEQFKYIRIIEDGLFLLLTYS